MPSNTSEPEPESLKPIIEKIPPCQKCGRKQFREAHRITQRDSTISIMYECAECGEYCL